MAKRAASVTLMDVSAIAVMIARPRSWRSRIALLMVVAGLLGAAPAYAAVSPQPFLDSSNNTSFWNKLLDTWPSGSPTSAFAGSTEQAAAAAGAMPALSSFGALTLGSSGINLGWRVLRSIDTRWLGLASSSPLATTFLPSGHFITGLKWAPVALTNSCGCYYTGAGGVQNVLPTSGTIWMLEGIQPSCVDNGFWTDYPAEMWYGHTGGQTPPVSANCLQLHNVDKLVSGTIGSNFSGAGAHVVQVTYDSATGAGDCGESDFSYTVGGVTHYPTCSLIYLTNSEMAALLVHSPSAVYSSQGWDKTTSISSPTENSTTLAAARSLITSLGCSVENEYNAALDSTNWAQPAANNGPCGIFGPLPAAATIAGHNDARPGICNCNGNVAHPVDVGTGDFYDTTTDASAATYGPPLAFARTYDASLAQSEAKATTPGPLGYGWTDNWNMSASLNIPVPNDLYRLVGSSSGTSGSSGNSGAAGSALLNAPGAVAVDAAGNVYIGDSGNNRVQEVAATTHTQWGISMTAGDVYTVAGSSSGTSGSSGDGGAATSALLNAPVGVAVDPAGNLFIADSGNNRVQEVAASTGTRWGVSMTANDVYTVAGSSSGSSGYSGDSGAATSALLNDPLGLELDTAGDLYVGDSGNNRVQEVAFANGTQWGVSMTANDIYTVAGSATGSSGLSGDGGAATSALLSSPSGLALDPAGDLYIADAANNRVQEIAAATGNQWGVAMTANDVYTVAGSSSGSAGHTGDGAAGTSALLSSP